MKLLTIDTETGGVDPSLHSILSLGAVVWDTDTDALREFEIYIAEDNINATPEALAMNRIDLHLLRGTGYKPEEAVKKFEAFLDGSFSKDEKIFFVGHNIAFDVGFLKRLYKEANVEYSRFSYRTLDTAGIGRFLNLCGVINSPSAGLEDMIKAFKIKVDAARLHGALYDAKVTQQVLSEMMRFVTPKPSSSFTQKDALLVGVAVVFIVGMLFLL